MDTIQDLIGSLSDNTFGVQLQEKIDNVISEHLMKWDGKMSKKEMAIRLKGVLTHELMYATLAVDGFEKDDKTHN